jgi:phenylalanyl-tRNA synthetase beta chain
MPVVQLNLNRLQKLVGKSTNKNKIVSSLPFLGLDIEEQTKEYVRVEYSPNRPDYATDFGIVMGLQGILGIKKGILKLKIKKGNYQLKVDNSVKDVRPYITALVAKNGVLDDEIIKQLITLQEDLHFGLGRGRKKASIGLHNLDNIVFPVMYRTTTKDHKFVPLDESNEWTTKEILEKTKVGKQYGAILENTNKIPIIVDTKGNTLSFPPIINSAFTAVTADTKNLFVEVTATDKNTAEDTLAVIAVTLQSAGFNLETVKISGAGNCTPTFNTKKMIMGSDFVNNVLGLNLSPSVIANSLKKSRLDAITKQNKIICTIPRFRFDILGPMDLVEEIVLGYGIDNLNPTLPSSNSVGQQNQVTNLLNFLSLVMIGLGYTEALNSCLVNKQIQYDLTKRDASKIIEVVESKSLEHTILRESIIPSLLDNLSKNVHEPYPQKLFEWGTIFLQDSPIHEKINLACVSAHKDANFSEMKSILQSALKTGFNIDCETKTSSHPPFYNGRTADIIVNKKTIGVIGEIDPQIVENFKIRVPVVAFEITLSGLIFD